MFNFTKYYEMDAPETALSPAAAMAKGGTKSEGLLDMSMPSTATPPPTKQPETATSAPPPASSETPPPASAESAKPEQTTPAATPPPAQPVVEKSWQEVLKSQQPDTILKELGFDEKVLKLAQEIKDADPKVLGIVNHWKNKGDVKAYLEALSTDYSGMSSEDVMRHQLRRDYPELSKEDFEVLYQDRVTDKYKLDPEMYSEDEVRKGKVLLAADSKKVREGLMKSQEDYFVPKAPDTSAAENEQAAIEQQRLQAQEAYKTEVTNDPFIKELITDRRMTIGSGDDKFNYAPPSPEALYNVMVDSNAWANAVFKQVQQADGTIKMVPDIAKQRVISAIATDMDGFFAAMAAHYKSLGAKTTNDLLENAKPPVGAPARSEAQPASAAAAMAKGGRIVRSS